ncbi:MAG: uroporphyrinogen-III C-methyltransferase [Acidimicrobiales bacterium]
MTVHLVGAGPGDPMLLTRRGAHLLGRADVVVHDRLIDPGVLALAGPGAELIDVGKRPSSPGGDGPPHARSQAEINALLIELGQAGKTVVRLKGGDPFVFGRGGEEAEALEAAGIAWDVVPGVSSAFAVPALAGIPVTHRGRSTSVTVVTGHAGGDGDPGDAGVDWGALARSGGTLVVLMGVATRADVARRLVEGGRAPDTPVAVLEAGTTAAERRSRTTLGALGTHPVTAPAILVVGPVAALDLAPPSGPLDGRTVVVTRGSERAAGLAEALHSAGARVLAVPVLETTAPADGGAALRRAAGGAGDYEWLAFTSANAVERFVPLLGDLRSLGRTRLAAVGDATAGALAVHQLSADLVPATASAEGLVDEFPPPTPGARVLFVRAEGARPTLAAGLAAKGWPVDEVVAYRTRPAPAPPEAMVAELARADAVTFASPSAVDAYLAARDGAGRPLGVPALVACIGPVTAGAARRAGLGGVTEARRPTPASLVEALVEAAAR